MTDKKMKEELINSVDFTEEIIDRLKALANDGCEIEVEKEIPLTDATLYLCKCDGFMPIAAIIYNDGELFHLRDWQSGIPESPEDIESYDWLSEDGRDTIILNGLPRLL